MAKKLVELGLKYRFRPRPVSVRLRTFLRNYYVNKSTIEAFIKCINNSTGYHELLSSGN